MKNKKDQHKHSLVTKTRWSIVMIDNRRNIPRKRNFLFVFTGKKALNHFCLFLSWVMLLFKNRKLEVYIYIAKYIMNNKSWRLNTHGKFFLKKTAVSYRSATVSFEKPRLTAVFCTAFNKTAVQSLITAVFYKTVIGGFKNHGTVSSNRGFWYRGCWRF
jgi:hypothetical protein